MRYQPNVPLLIAVVSLAAATGHALREPPSDRVLPYYDARDSRPHVVVEPSSAQLAALHELQAKTTAKLRARFTTHGTVRWLHAFGATIAVTDAVTPEVAARKFLSASPALFGLRSTSADDLVVTFIEPSATGVTHVGFVQQIDGIPLFQGYVRVDVGKDGAILAAGVTTTADAPATGVNSQPSISPHNAVELAAKLVGLSAIDVSPADSLVASPLMFRVDRCADPVTAELVWFSGPSATTLAWRVRISPPGYPTWYELLIDANNGSLLRRANLLFYAETEANVFADNPDRSARTTLPLFDDSVNVALDWPLGWLYIDRTDGNNVIARDDRAADNEVTLGILGIATPGVPQRFDPPYTADPIADINLSVANLFAGINRMHEHFYALGFNESAGNFQTDNFGRGGRGGDAVRGDAQDSADTLLDADPTNDVANNANFATPPDGQQPRMQMYLFNNPTPLRDADLDMDVVFHEFCHGLSTRLVGGRGDAGCLFQGQPGAMGEAWGDFFAGSVLDDPIVGEHSTQDFVNGIRTAPMSADSYTYGDLCAVAAQCEVHADGEIWAQTLWEVRAAMINVYGFAAGRQRAEQLVVDAMKLSPCMPSFLDMRDAVLMADDFRYAGVDRCLLWTVFAQNGMGELAVDETAGDPTMPQEDFTVPSVCRTGLGQVDWHIDRLTCDSVGSITVTDTDLLLPTSVTITSTAGDSETFPLTSAAGGAAFTAQFPVVGVATATNVVLGDGILQAVRGDTLTVSYRDLTDGGQRTDVATLVCRANVTMLGYRFVNATCDADTLPGYPDLPGFLDAGESAILEVDLVNREDSALDDVVVVLTSSNPLVTIVPAAPVPVGRLEATVGTHLSERTIRFLASADPSVVSGATATLSLSLTARGVDGPVTPIVWILTLNQDYQIVPRTFTEDFETSSPTVGQWTHMTTRPTPTGDDWRVVTCQSSSGARSYKNGGASPTCGNYSDNQGDPYLASPALVLQPPGAIDARVRRLAFQHRVRLAVPRDPTGFCDAEAVAVMLTDDPSAIDTTDPFSLLGSVLGFYTVVTLPLTPPVVIDDNTTGFVLQDLDLSLVPLTFNPQSAVYITWVMAIDYTNQYGGPLCALFNQQGEGYYLDDVVLEWDEVVAVPQATVCTPTCLALAQSDPESAATCTTTDLSAVPSLITGCTGQLEYQWSGGDLGPPVGYSAVTDVTVTPTAPTRYALDVRCNSNPTCADSTTVLVIPGGSGPPPQNLGNVLNAARVGSVVRLDWSTQPLSPRRYNVHEVAVKIDVVDATIAATTPVARPDDIETVDVSTSGNMVFYEVFARNLCTGGSSFP